MKHLLLSSAAVALMALGATAHAQAPAVPAGESPKATGTAEPVEKPEIQATPGEPDPEGERLGKSTGTGQPVKEPEIQANPGEPDPEGDRLGKSTGAAKPE